MLEGTYTLRILEDFFDLFFRIGPYLVVSIFINVMTLRYFNGRTIHFSLKGEVWSILTASLIGLVSPMPAYAAIPLGVSLISAGIPFSAIMAFIISSPLINPAIFFLTATQMGMEMAVIRTIAAFILGVTGGLLTIKLFRYIYCDDIVSYLPVSKAKRSLLSEIYRNSIYTLKTFSVAILLSSAVKALVPAKAISYFLGYNVTTGTLMAIALGVPFYTCGGAAIPFMQTLMDMGMSKGAVLAFFIAGPATKLETLYAYRKMLGAKVLTYFLVLTLLFSYIAGMIYSLF